MPRRLPQLPAWEAFLAVREGLASTARSAFIAARDTLIFDVAAVYGLRIGEVLSLRVARVDLDRGAFLVLAEDEKTRQEKTYPLTPALADRFDAYFERYRRRLGRYVFPSLKGGRLVTGHWLVYRFGVARAAAGMDEAVVDRAGRRMRRLHFHQLRMHAMTRWFQAGYNVKEVAAFFQVHELTAMRYYWYVEESRVKGAILTDQAVQPVIYGSG